MDEQKPLSLKQISFAVFIQELQAVCLRHVQFFPNETLQIMTLIVAYTTQIEQPTKKSQSRVNPLKPQSAAFLKELNELMEKYDLSEAIKQQAKAEKQ